MIKVMRSPARLDALLNALEHELIEASDEEIHEAATELGMNLAARRSAAFLGVKFAYAKRLEDIFDLDSLDEETRARYLAWAARLRALKGPDSK